MFDRADSLLPKSATDLARALDVLEERLFALPVEMITKDVDQVAPELLEHLAWEYSVDSWGAGLSEDLKRRIVTVSEEVHRYKGTPYGIQVALAVFGFEVEILEWFDPDGSGVRGTFSVSVFVTDPIDVDSNFEFGPSLIESVGSVLATVAPISRGWSLNIGWAAGAACYAGVFQNTAILASASAVIPPPPEITLLAGPVLLPTTHINVETRI
ncbi:phage tail protein I [Yoonia sp. I 8.24]|uniref:phage tail protein I n=1 Tax=Yoonia sp. I 8.24 TaxID=1537229 RepID=UPI001EE0857C|nr:phage tail protein I [Yoonia sp. I 8.24]MCG3266115.1 phage tail protein I [Yoonia sp. I 8.24]